MLFHKRYFFVLLILIASFHDKIEARNLLIEGKAGYFIPDDSLFQKIYSSGGIYGAEISLQLCHCFYGWFSASQFEKKGHSLGLESPTNLQMVPLGLGLKCLGCWYKNIQGYFGLGVLGTYLNIHDEDPYVIPHVQRWAVGALLKEAPCITWGDACILISVPIGPI